MPIATTKAELLSAIDKEYMKLQQALDPLTDAQMIEPGVCHAWSAKDVLAHLTEWASMFFDWYERGCRGETFRLPADDLKWNQTPELNDRIYRKWKNTPLPEVRKMFVSSHQRVKAFVQDMPEDRLFQKDLYPWMSTWTLSRWTAAVSSSHYAWAVKHLRAFGKQR